MDSNTGLKNIIKENYLKVKTLLRTKDPDENPHKSNNEAKEILCDMKTILKENICKESELQMRENARIAGVYYLLGTVYMSTEENAYAEAHLLECYNIIQDHSCHSDNVLCAIACLNQIGLLYATSLRHNDALNYLQKAVEMYKSYTADPTYDEPLSLLTMFTDMAPKLENNGKIILDKTYTLTLYYLAQVYTALQDREKGAMFCHETLKRQIESNDYDHIDWAVNAATMSQVLIEKNAFREARHHLAAASFVLEEYEKKLTNNEGSPEESENLDARKEELSRRRSDILRCWIKYCIVLLTFSKDRLMSDDDDSPNCEQPPEELKGISFPTLKDSLKESVVSCAPILTFDDARPVFLFGQECCNEATKYYTLTEHASDYTSISLDHSQLYMALAFFEGDEDRQCKMLKKRLDILTSVTKHLNPNYYLDVCRELWISLGQICTDMVELKVKKARLSADPTARQIIKVNTLVEDGVNYYTIYITSFVDKRTNKMPSAYPREHERTIILANLYAARLYSKYILPNKDKSMEIDKKCLGYYQAIVDYARSHNHIAKEMASEVRIADDMLILLPYKLTRMSQLST